MSKLYGIVTIAMLMLFPSIASGLALGNITSSSKLNEQFEAKIVLLNPSVTEIDSLEVGLADSEIFKRMKISRPLELGKLQFEVVIPEEGTAYIRVYSKIPISEPFLNFLIEVQWDKGRIYREYTLLLDPPLYDSSQLASPKRPVHVDAEDFPIPVEIDEDGVAVDDRTIVFTGDEYGPTISSDTLWSIAKKTRPHTGVTINQMMIAIYNANPQAFWGNNINNLKRGEVLRVPDEQNILAVSAPAALAEAQAHHVAWGGSVAQTLPELPELITPKQPTQPQPTKPQEVQDQQAVEQQVADQQEPQSELRLIGTEEGDSSQAGVENAKAFILAEESLAVAQEDNKSLEQQLNDNKVLIEDVNRWLKVQSEQLAVLQEQASQTKESIPSEVIQEDVEIPEEVMAEEALVDDIAEEVMAEDLVEESLVDDLAEEVMAEDLAEESLVDDIAEEVMAEDSNVEVGAVTEDELILQQIEEELSSMPEVQSETTSVEEGFVTKYTNLIKNMILNNIMIIIGFIVIVVVLAITYMLMKHRKSKKVMEQELDDDLDALFDADADFDQLDMGDSALDDANNMEPVTIIPNVESQDVELEEQMGEDFIESTQTQMLSPSMLPQEESIAVEEEDDLFQEVNTYLVFEQFDEAESYMRSALEEQPDNMQLQVKLLEVFYTSGNRKSYEEVAKTLHDKVNGQGPHWDVAQAMWNEISPNRGLFAEGVDDDEADVPSKQMVDLTAPDSFMKSADMIDSDIEDIFGTGSGDFNGEATVDRDNSEATVDRDHEDDAASADVESELDMDFDIGDSVLDETVADSDSEAQDETGDIDFDIDVDDGGLNETVADSDSEDQDEIGDIDFDIDIDDGELDEIVADSDSEDQDEIGDIDELDVEVADSEDDMSLDIDIDQVSDAGILDITSSNDDDEYNEEEDILDVTSPSYDADGEESFDIEQAPETNEAVEFDVSSTEPIEDSNEVSVDEGGGDDTDDYTWKIASAGSDEQAVVAQGDEYENDTKLDLAKAYIELGDVDNAKVVLDEVMTNGNNSQKSEAQSLSSQL